MQISAHLNFNGQCEEAFHFYQRCLGGKIEALATYESTPAAGQVPAEWRKKIIHARLNLDGQVLLGVDAPPDRFKPPAGFSVTVQVEDPADAERIFHALAENGKVVMPVQETFWAIRFGMLVDRFGIPWMVNCGRSS